MATPRATISEGHRRRLWSLLLVASVLRVVLEGTGDAGLSSFILFTAFIPTVLT